ncbi:prepilin-type N-terminal cleavage/methylation domain-containing protein [Tissierella sp.]|uniref:prepilin-type N-terminal cleavage/methylation domain-containing protein n=1 Tax=Tissierella sp. TaxID=41274 RepID=UPI002864FC93|nr:prepilin-type N-terminal cleavage/methylation domain-containing protein [Tissierella sp.]MDR7856130.1 prepilin-type N-terminal cleavage/methylation domain-containing protein [Tissierella sp.]
MKKGFTLVETLIGLCLLGLIAVTVLPIINSSFYRTSIHNTKIEMIYLGELVVEKIKAYDIEKGIDTSIYDTRVLDIIKLFQVNDNVEMIIPQSQINEKYNIKIIKKEKSERLWELSVFVYENKEGSKVDNVQYKAYLPSK